nr:MAG TPA: hypothetical protein [Caudoviricetes sp.]DAN04365.1 MAG TPA: hypothetical protein [Caudoviricetes sp.]DAZ40415.1 MAG TPA: hypothetical protein [Caudoviricetes sp.]
MPARDASSLEDFSFFAIVVPLTIKVTHSE